MISLSGFTLDEMISNGELRIGWAQEASRRELSAINAALLELRERRDAEDRTPGAGIEP